MRKTGLARPWPFRDRLCLQIDRRHDQWARLRDQALDLAEDLNNNELDAIRINLRVVYKDLSDYPKAITLFSDAATKMAAERTIRSRAGADEPGPGVLR